MTDANNLRKYMNLLNESFAAPLAEAEEKGEYYHEKDGDDWHVFHTDKGNGKAYGTHSEESDAKKDAATRNGKIDESVDEDCDEEDLDEAVISETGNANAQMKGINFKGTPAKKNSGDMDQSSPKSKGPGSKTSLAQAKSGTTVGQKKY